MVVFSRFRALVGPAKTLLSKQKVQPQAVRFSHDRLMEIKPSAYHYKLFFDDVHFYLCLTGIPVILLITGVNIFIGPATLSDIPEGYEPEDHEFHRHPISRFILKYLAPSPQSIYEKNMAALKYNHDKYLVKRIRDQVKALSYERGDYQAWAYVPQRAELMTRVSIRDAEIISVTGHYYM